MTPPPLTPVILCAPKQRHQVDLLVAYCKDLDGTEVKVLHPEQSNVPYPAITNWAFLETCKVMKGKPFFWLEPDSIPTKAGWLKAIQKEWDIAQGFGKKILWTTDTNPPHDICTGIGAYSSDILDILPEEIPSSMGFDGWLYDNRYGDIQQTSLIQHSYGSYPKGEAVLHRHPVPREDAVIFHKDQYQDILWKGKSPKHFGSSGDLGDIIYLLPLIQQLGGKHCLWLYNRPFTKDIESRFHLIEPLIAAQPYIQYVAIGSGKQIDYDLSEFRHQYVPERTLLASQGAYGLKTFKLPTAKGDKQWLFVKSDKRSKGRVVIARSPRYHNGRFPWAKIVQHYGDSLAFVGLPEEHADFCKAFGEVERIATKDLLETAQLIAGSDLFIGNQSSPFALAEGLKHPRIQETNLRVPDCVFPGSTLCADGGVRLPAAGGREALEIASPMTGFREINPQETPPGSWQYPECRTEYNLIAISNELAGREKISLNAAMKKVFDLNCERVPDFFRNTYGDAQLARVKRAMNNAGL